jgi:nucleoside-diphosphate-sugar epimerase
MKKILITGGAGYLGSILTETLLNNGYEVTVFDSLLYKQLSLVNFCHNKKFNFIKGDVRDKTTLRKLVNNHDVIIPLAAIVGMPACQSSPNDAIDINYIQIKDIIEFSSNNQMIVLPNTNSQYGYSDKIITEDSPFNPLSLYAKTKCDAEKEMLDSGNGISLRLATVFGLSYRMRMDLLVQDFVYKSLTDGYLVLFESHFVRNYVHVRDVANTFLFMIENYEKCNNNSFNVGLSNANLTKLQLSEKIKSYIPELIIVKNDFTKDFDQRNYIVSNQKLESKGWSPKYTIDDGIKELIQGFEIIKVFKNKDFTNL